VTVSEIRRRRLSELEVEVGLAALRTWWAVEAHVDCPYCGYCGWITLTYSAPVDYPQEGLERLHEHVRREVLEHPWSVTDETRRHRDECWPEYSGLPDPGELGQDGVGAPAPGAGRSGTRPGGCRGPADDETGGR
jgi:hypothetical protein